VVGFTLATLKLYNQAPQHFEFLLSPNGVARTGHLAEDLVHSSSIGLSSIQIANEDVMNIYVGNLPFTITEDKLMDLFVGFGEVARINLITDKATGELRGFGFVEMPTQSEAEAAIKGLNGTSVGGMTIQVNIARDRRRR
jgi:RNA recognition motif-containing protein